MPEQKERSGQMEKEGWMIVGVILCAMILLFVALRKNSEWLMNFILRGIMGTIGIYMINQLLIMQGMSCTVGINPCTVLTSAGLGFPGLILLFGLRLYNFLSIM